MIYNRSVENKIHREFSTPKNIGIKAHKLLPDKYELDIKKIDKNAYRNALNTPKYTYVSKNHFADENFDFDPKSIAIEGEKKNYDETEIRQFSDTTLHLTHDDKDIVTHHMHVASEEFRKQLEEDLKQKIENNTIKSRASSTNLSVNRRSRAERRLDKIIHSRDQSLEKLGLGEISPIAALRKNDIDQFAEPANSVDENSIK